MHLFDEFELVVHGDHLELLEEGAVHLAHYDCEVLVADCVGLARLRKTSHRLHALMLVLYHLRHANKVIRSNEPNPHRLNPLNIVLVLKLVVCLEESTISLVRFKLMLCLRQELLEVDTMRALLVIVLLKGLGQLELSFDDEMEVLEVFALVHGHLSADEADLLEVHHVLLDCHSCVPTEEWDFFDDVDLLVDLVLLRFDDDVEGTSVHHCKVTICHTINSGRSPVVWIDECELAEGLPLPQLYDLLKQFSKMKMFVMLVHQIMTCDNFAAREYLLPCLFWLLFDHFDIVALVRI